MDKELLKKYLSMFQVSIIIIVVALGISLVLLTKSIPQIGLAFTHNRQIQEAKDNLSDKQNELENLKAEKAKRDKLNEDVNDVKEFYRDIKNSGNSSSEILADELKEIHDLISYYGIKVYRENNEYDFDADPFFKSDKNKYSVCKMNLELFSTYMKYQSFLSDLYKHPHFLNVESIEINPYKKDKTILDIKMVLILYAEKTSGTSGRTPEKIDNGTNIPPASGASSGNYDNPDLDLDLDI